MPRKRFLYFSVAISTSTSKPKPDTLKNILSLAMPTSMAFGDSSSSMVRASLGSVGIFSAFARSLPVPKGSNPSTESVFTSPWATSFRVPSPPTDTIYFSPPLYRVHRQLCGMALVLGIVEGVIHIHFVQHGPGLRRRHPLPCPPPPWGLR